MGDDRITAGAGVGAISSNVLPSYFGPAVELGGEFDPYGYHYYDTAKVAFDFSLSDFSSEPEGIAAGLKFMTNVGDDHFQLRFGSRIDYVRDLDNGEDYQGVLLGLEAGPRLDFRYASLDFSGGVGFGFIDRGDVARVSTQYTFGGMLNFNIPFGEGGSRQWPWEVGASRRHF